MNLGSPLWQHHSILYMYSCATSKTEAEAEAAPLASVSNEYYIFISKLTWLQEGAPLGNKLCNTYQPSVTMILIQNGIQWGLKILFLRGTSRRHKGIQSSASCRDLLFLCILLQDWVTFYLPFWNFTKNVLLLVKPLYWRQYHFIAKLNNYFGTCKLEKFHQTQTNTKLFYLLF